MWNLASRSYTTRLNPPGKYDGSVTEARSWPVSNSTSPFACSTTYTLIGRGGSQRREVSSHQYSGFFEPWACSGWISTLPVLITDTARTGSPVPVRAGNLVASVDI